MVRRAASVGLCLAVLFAAMGCRTCEGWGDPYRLSEARTQSDQPIPTATSNDHAAAVFSNFNNGPSTGYSVSATKPLPTASP